MNASFPIRTESYGYTYSGFCTVLNGFFFVRTKSLDSSEKKNSFERVRFRFELIFKSERNLSEASV